MGVPHAYRPQPPVPHTVVVVSAVVRIDTVVVTHLRVVVSAGCPCPRCALGLLQGHLDWVGLWTMVCSDARALLWLLVPRFLRLSAADGSKMVVKNKITTLSSAFKKPTILCTSPGWCTTLPVLSCVLQGAMCHGWAFGEQQHTSSNVGHGGYIL